MKTGWSEQYNRLPFETRIICSAVLMENQILQLVKEKRRLEKHYHASLLEINEHIDNIRRSLKELEAQNDT